MITTIDQALDLSSDAAKRIFDDEGHVAPCMQAITEMGSMMSSLLPAGHPSDYILPVTSITLTVPTVRFVTFIAESWTRTEPKEKFPEGGYPRGTLEQLEKEGDPDVHTAVVVATVEVKALRIGTVVLKPMKQDDGTNVWTDFNQRDYITFGQKTNGFVHDQFFAAITLFDKITAEHPVPGKPTLQSVLMFLARVGLSAGGYIAAVKDDESAGVGDDD